jgi:hypothetical protein
MRTTRELREKLEREAAASGRSLAQEVEYRLQRSLLEEDLLTGWLGGEHISTLARYIAVMMQLVEREFGKKWDEDAYTCIAANAAVAETWKKIVQLTLEKLPEIANEKDAERQGQWLGKAFADSFEQRHPFRTDVGSGQ